MRRSTSTSLANVRCTYEPNKPYIDSSKDMPLTLGKLVPDYATFLDFMVMGKNTAIGDLQWMVAKWGTQRDSPDETAQAAAPTSERGTAEEGSETSLPGSTSGTWRWNSGWSRWSGYQ